MSDSTNQGWGEWSKHVLKELERLNHNYESLTTRIDSIRTDIHSEISDIKNDITKVKAMQYSLDELKLWKRELDNASVLKSVQELEKWKNEVDDVVSPKQIADHIERINSLEKFKVQAITGFLIFQALIGIGIAIAKYLM